MRRFVILLRGINVGGRNRLPMADLRSVLEAAGLADVRTYIQSGNIVLSSPVADPEAVAAQVRAVIADGFGLDVPTVALTEDDLLAAIAANPYPAVPDPKRLHAIVLPAEPAEAALQIISDRQAAARDKGGRDSVTVVGRIAYLSTPDGFGDSALATSLLSSRSSPLAGGTARNWATMSALVDLVRG